MALSLKVGQNPLTLKNYLATVKQNNSGKESPVEVMFPEVKTQLTSVAVARYSSVDQATFGTRSTSSLLSKQITRWRILEEQCKRAVSGGVLPIGFKSTVPVDVRNQFTFNEQPLMLDSTDEALVTIPLFNPLHNTLQLSKFRLRTDSPNVEATRCDQLDETVLLDSNVTVSLVFRVRSAQSVERVVITGIEYDLSTPDADDCVLVRAFQTFRVQGSRMNNTTAQRKGAFYADDKRLEIDIKDNVPRARLRLSRPLPSSILSDELVEITLIATNEGARPLRNCWINHNCGGNIQIRQDEQEKSMQRTAHFSSLNGLIQLKG